jgi:DNA modification methylase
MMEPVRIGDATLYLGDCRDILPGLGPVDALVTDPPYGVDFAGKATKYTEPGGGYVSGDDPMVGPNVVAEALNIAERGVVFPGSRMMHAYPKPYDIGCVYCPAGAGYGRWGFTVFHPILYYGKALEHGRHNASGFESFAKVKEKRHPCAKPMEWITWCVAKSTIAGDIVFDPFMGSGTAGAVCAETGRRFIGIEKEPEYFDIACERIEMAYAQERLFA